MIHKSRTDFNDFTNILHTPVCRYSRTDIRMHNTIYNITLYMIYE